MRDQLTVLREPLEGRALEDRVVSVDIVENLGLEHEEPAVDPPFAHLWLLRELRHEVAIEHETAEACRRAHRRNGRELPVATVELEQRPRVHTADAVAIGHHERLAAQLVGEPAKPPARLRLEPRVTEVHHPVLAFRPLHGDLVRAKVDAEAVPEVEVIEEVALDDVAAIP